MKLKAKIIAKKILKRYINTVHNYDEGVIYFAFVRKRRMFKWQT
jgi:hypothetical protein